MAAQEIVEIDITTRMTFVIHEDDRALVESMLHNMVDGPHSIKGRSYGPYPLPLDERTSVIASTLVTDVAFVNRTTPQP